MDPGCCKMSILDHSGSFRPQPSPARPFGPGRQKTDFPGSPGGPETCFTDRQIGWICCETTLWNLRCAHFERPAGTFENGATCICHRGRDLEIVNRPIQTPLLDHSGPFRLLDHSGPFRPQPSNPSPARPFGPGRQKPTYPGRPGGPGRVSRIARSDRFAVKRPLGISGAPILSARLACLKTAPRASGIVGAT